MRGDVVSVENSGAGAVIGDKVRLSGSRAGVTVASQAEFGENSSTIFLLAREVHGPIQPVFDTRGSLMAGLVAGAVLGTLLMVSRLFRR